MMRFVLIIFLLSFSSASANDFSIKAERVKNNSIKIDGLVLEQEWAKVDAITNMTQKDPVQGKESTGKAEIKFLYDDNFLYISAILSHGGEIRATTSRRDNAGNSERIIFAFDTFKDLLTAYSFGITATGVRIDYYHQNDNEYSRDYSFDPIWEAKTQIYEDRWTVEVAIPFTQLRFNDADELIWGLNMNWWVPSLREDDYWVLIPKNESGWSSRMGTLTGIKNIKQKQRIELMPYLAGGLDYNPHGDNKNPFYDEYSPNYRVGADLKIGLGPDFTLDATINPDFGQVEADPAEVNLTAYETFFSEKRPFFIEGKQLLQGYGNNFFYSRRIGQRPQLRPDGNHTENPNSTDIYGAAKITGRTKDGLSLGFLSALTASTEGSGTDIIDSNIINTMMTAPMSSYSVFRVKKELNQQQLSSIGLLLTNVYRDVNVDENLRNYYLKNAVSGDFDWFFRFDSSTYQFDGHLGFSYIYGDSNAISLVQQSPAHYFQRPDEDYLELDNSLTSLTGLLGSASFAKIAGENWLWNTSFSFITPGVELNDIGRMHKADKINYNAEVRYRENTPNDLFYNYKIILWAGNEWDFGGNHLQKQIFLSPNFTFNDRSSLMTGLWYNFEALSNSLTRGGPLMRTSANWGIRGEYSTDWSANNQYSIYSQYDNNDLGGKHYYLTLSASLKFFDRLHFSIAPNFIYGTNPRQYVTTMSGDNPDTYNKRYIFAHTERNIWSTQIRLNYAFTPDMTLELYLEPFAANGKFTNYGELEEAKTDNLLIYGEDGTTIESASNSKYKITDGNEEFQISKRDFNDLSFRSNLVLRWEFLPGSYLYLIWQQNKSRHYSTFGSMNADYILDAYDSNGINTFALKFSYWLPAI